MKQILVLSLLILISSSNAQQGKKFNPLSSRTAFGLEGGVTIPKTDFRKTEFDYLAGISADYYFATREASIFGISFAGSFGYASGSERPGYKVYYPPLDEFRTQIIMLSAGVSYTLTSWDAVYPYAALRGGWINFEPRDKDGNDLSGNVKNEYSPNDWFVNGEAGFKFPISDVITFKIGGSINYLPFDNLDDSPNEITGGSDPDILFTVTSGFQFYFGGVSDQDSDGVPDNKDLCPDTPSGVIVDESGCPVDTDRDGVPDYLDECPNTPVNIPVDENGCPSDADRDGVPDFRDLCPDTPKDVPVDERGCSFDSDGDGVPDYMDICPGTPIGVEVDKWGCEIKEEVTTVLPETKFVLSGTLNFEVGKASLLPNAVSELDRMVKVMKEYPDTKWRISGHTDDTGPYSLNKKLSYDRAVTVYNYLTASGIDKDRFKIVGMGPDNPVADNATETGRSLNRRVEIAMLDEKTNFAYTPGMTSNDDYRYNTEDEKNVGNMIFTDGRLFCVQVSSWRDQYKAEAEVNRLKTLGYNAFITEANLHQLDGKWFRVRVGFYDTLSEARLQRGRLAGL